MKKAGLILSGGGARGLAHIGVLKALEENRIKVSAIAASSMGIIVGVLYASGLSAKKIEQLAHNITWKEVVKLVNFSFSSDGIIKTDRIAQYVLNFLKAKKFEELKIPLVTNATDILNEKEVIFDKGDLYTAIRAGIAFPGIFTPEKINKTILMDGGLVNPLALGLLKNHTLDFLIIVNVETGLGGKINLENPGMRDILKRSVDIMQDELIKLKLCTIQEDYVLIRPNVEQVELFELNDAKKLIVLGENATLKKIEKIKKMYFTESRSYPLHSVGSV